jgi:DHA2 family methylenomycin A resistance protein-like MFS transporter
MSAELVAVRTGPARVSGDGPSARAVLFSALLGFVVIALDASAVNVALPAIGESLHGSTAALQWIVDAYTLMFAALLLSAGALSDRLGANRVFAVGIGVFTLASVACGVAPGLGLLVAGRLVQGAAAAVVLPSSLALVRQAFPDPVRRARAIALWTVGGAVAVAAGPIAGGLLTSAVSWRAIFFINLPVGAVTVLLASRAPGSPRRAAALDPFGQLAAVVALAALTFGVIEGGDHGFGRPTVIGCLVVAAAATVAFVGIEQHVGEPMVPLELFRSRTVTVCVLIGFSVNAAFYGVVFLFSLFFQQIQHQSAVDAGMMFLPMTALIAFANLASARVAARFGARVPIAFGQLISLVGLLGLLTVDPQTSRPVVALLLIPVGVGLGFAVPSLTAAMLSDIAADRAGLAAGVLNSGRQTGGALAVAVFGALIAQPAPFTRGLHETLLIAAVLLLATTVTAVALPRSR